MVRPLPSVACGSSLLPAACAWCASGSVCVNLCIRKQDCSFLLLAGVHPDAKLLVLAVSRVCYCWW